MTVGFRIRTDFSRPDPSLVSEFSAIASADLSDVMHSSYTLSRAIAPVHVPVARVVGPAVTISVPTASLAVLKIGLEQTRSGDVVMVNGMASISTAFIGANILRGLKHRGVAAFVVDGAVRDVSEIRQDGLPTFARGVATALGPAGPDAGEVNYPIACGGVVVNPGDIVVADEDGIVVIPAGAAGQVLQDVRQLQRKFEALQPMLMRGEVTGIAQITQSLKEAGLEFANS